MDYTMKERRINEIVSNFSSRNILVIGDVGVDKYTYGTVTRISPEAPVPVVAVTEEKFKLGLAANVASNIFELGGKVILCGAAGKDTAKEYLFDILKEKKISTSEILLSHKRRTSIKERVVANIQQLVRIDYEEPASIDSDIEKKAYEIIKNKIDSVNAIIIEDYAKGFCTSSLCKKVINLANSKGILVAVDPNRNSDIDSFHGCSIIEPNLDEAEALLKAKGRTEEAFEKLGTLLLEKTESRIALITRGGKGIGVFVRDDDNNGEIKCFNIPAFTREVYDVSGAGDTVISMFVLSLISGSTCHEAAILANFAAGVVVGKSGTATVSVEELLNYIEMVGRLSK